MIFLENNFNVGNRLREIRTGRGLSQEQVAYTANITSAYYGQVERGEKNVTVFKLEKICHALNLSLAEFFTPTQKEDKHIDDISMQIIHQLTNISDFEKEKVLKLIKLIFSNPKIKRK